MVSVAALVRVTGDVKQARVVGQAVVLPTPTLQRWDNLLLLPEANQA